MADIAIGTAGALNDAASVAEGLGSTGTHISVNNCPFIYDATTVAEVVSTPTFALKLYRGMNSVTVTLITVDWDFVALYRKFAGLGVALKGIILIPGSGAPDTFSIKDGDENGSYLYSGALTVPTVLVYPGSLCRPYIDYSECTLTAGHKVTFVW